MANKLAKPFKVLELTRSDLLYALENTEKGGDLAMAEAIEALSDTDMQHIADKLGEVLMQGSDNGYWTYCERVVDSLRDKSQDNG